MKHLKQIYAALLMTVFTMPAFSGDVLAPPSGSGNCSNLVRTGCRFIPARRKTKLIWRKDSPMPSMGRRPCFSMRTASRRAPMARDRHGPSATARRSPAKCWQNSPRQNRVPFPGFCLRSNPMQGAGTLDAVEFVRRVDTDGGAEPADGCGAVAVRHDGPRSLFGEVSIFWKIDFQSFTGNRTPEAEPSSAVACVMAGPGRNCGA